MSLNSTQVQQAVTTALEAFTLTLQPTAFRSDSATNGDKDAFVETGYATVSFMILCSALVMIMTPGVGLLYAGLARSKNALSVFLLCFLCYAIVVVQWILFGFSLAFSETGSPIIGNFDFGGFRNVFSQALLLTAPQMPAVLFALYQMQFACVTASLIFGSVIERVRILPSMMFIFLWTTLVYDPVAYWTWGARGWIKNMSCLSTTSIGQTPCAIGGLDFAGGGPVHMASGAAALAFCIFLGHRQKSHKDFHAHNLTLVFLGTGILWMGWFGFNAGSAFAPNVRAAYAALATTAAAASGALGWLLAEFTQSGKFSGIALCSGAVAGLVGVTPAAGFVSAWAALVIGFLTGVLCSLAVKVKALLNYDDSADAWGLHGVGGFVGSVMTGLFASKSIAALDGTKIVGGGFIDGEWKLLGYNLAGSMAILTWSFIGSLIIIYAIDNIPGFRFRVARDEELLGADTCEMGEVAYLIDTSTTDYAYEKSMDEITSVIN